MSKDLLKKVKTLKGFSKADIKALKSLGKLKKFNKGDIIFNKNDSGKKFYILKKGEVQIFTELGNKDKIISVLSENDFFGELALLGIGYRTASAVAIKDSEVYVISMKDFESLLLNNKEFTLKLLYIMAERLRKTDEEIENLLFYNIFGRVIKFLYESCRKNNNTELSITQDDIAKNLGTTRIPVNRVLQRLKNKGIITLSRGKIIIDEKKLNSIMERFKC
ncbi:MAG: Crp/Fnr family transcriptional regulator [Elusimicrobia bacterium]|jgi:CRP/FNR family cyclic AMP-dependent transcriptional regulator|nr:Crp/Fnr family transcriptional regulator [Elusimicrobiota bacterium]